MKRKITYLLAFVLAIMIYGSTTVNAQNLDKFTGAIVYDQSGETSGSSSSYVKYKNGSQYSNAYESTDDFIVENSDFKFSTLQVKASSEYNIEYLSGFNVAIYSDLRMPATELIKIENISDFIIDGLNILIDLGQEIALEPGAYWISVQGISHYVSYSSYSLKWASLANYDSHIEMQPYKRKISSSGTIYDWGAASSSTYNLYMKLNTKFVDDLTISMVSPTSSPSMTDSEEIGVEIFNAGSATQNSFEVQYSINGGTPVVEAVNATIEPFEGYVYGFSQLADLSDAGDYEIEVSVNLTGDENVSNNSEILTIENQGFVYAMNDDLNGTIVNSCEGRITDPGGLNDYFSDNGSGTKKFTLMPDAANNRSVVEFSEFNYLNSKNFITIYDGEDETAPILGELNSNKQDGSENPIFTATNSQGALTIVLSYDYAYQIDYVASVSCYLPPEKDLGIVDVVAPSYGAEFNATEDVAIAVKNFGWADQTNVTVSYSLNNGTKLTGVISSIPSGTVSEFVFAKTVDMTAAADYNFDFEVILDGDENVENNTLSKTFSNYGAVYKINADTILRDTLMVCSGVLTDDGGPDNPGLTQSGELGAELYTLLMPEEDGYRMEFELKELDLDNGAFYLTDATKRDQDMWVRYYESDQPYRKFLGTNAEGAISVTWYTAYAHGKADGFIGEIRCVPIEEEDFMIYSLELSKPIVRVADDIVITSEVKNIGSLSNSETVYLKINDVVVDSVTTMELAAVESEFIAFDWVPEEEGNYAIDVFVADGGDEFYNIQSTSIWVYKYRQIVETFDNNYGEEPYGWYTEVGNWKMSKNTSGSYDMVGSAETRNADVLHSPRLQIADGDSITFYAMTADYVMTGPMTGYNVDGNGELQVGWYNVITGETHMFDTVYSDLGMNHELITVDISEAKGINEIVFESTKDGEHLAIDYIVGPPMVISGNDVEIVDFSIPTYSKVGDKTLFKVTLNSACESDLTGTEYTIDLYNVGEDEPFRSVEGTRLVSLNETEYIFDHVYETTDSISIYAVINMEGDLDISNNTSTIQNAVVLDFNLNDVFVGDEASTTTSGYYPILGSTSYKSSLSEVLYTLDQVGETGEIEQVGLVQKTYGTNVAEDIFVKIWMGTTELTSLTDTTIPSNNLTLVFEDSVNIPQTNSQKTEYFLPLKESFNYDGNNLVMLVYTYTNGANTANYWVKSSVDSIQVNYFYAKDSISADGTNFDMTGLNTPKQNSDKYIPNTLLLFNKSAIVTATVKNSAGELLEGAEAKFSINNTEMYSGLSNNKGVIAIEDIAYGEKYNLTCSLKGYDTFTIDDIEIVSGTNDLGEIVIDSIVDPMNIVSTVNDTTHTAVVTWNTKKAYAHYNVYLNEELVADSINTASYTFNNLTDGENVVGIKAIYDGGFSEMVTDTFHVCYAPTNIDAKLYADNTAGAVWNFDGTSSDFSAFQVSLNGIVIDTLTSLNATVSELVDGNNIISVLAIYTKAGNSYSVSDTVVVINNETMLPVTNVTVAVDSVDAILSWTGNDADSYAIFLNSDTIFATTPNTITTYTLADLAVGTYMAGVAAVYNGVPSTIENVAFSIGADIKTPAVQDLTAVVDEANNSAAIAWAANNADTYNVYVNGELAENVTDATYTIENLINSYYVVGVVAVYGEVESAMATVDFNYTKVGVTDANAFDFNIYPNPTSNWISIDGAQNSTIQIFSISGAVILVHENYNTVAKINLSELASGLYIVKVTNNEGSAIKRLTVE